MAKMLIVDDSIDNRDFCGLLAGMLDIDVRQAGDVGEALEILGEGFVPEVVLLDLVMPGREPEELIQYIKADPRYGHTKVILTSAMRELGLLAEHMGADDSLIKPYDLAQVVDSFRRVSHVAG